MGNRIGAVLWALAAACGYLTYTSAQKSQGGELIFAPLTVLFLLLAFIVGGVPWKV